MLDYLVLGFKYDCPMKNVATVRLPNKPEVKIGHLFGETGGKAKIKNVRYPKVEAKTCKVQEEVHGKTV